jgi:hypothetical protein
MKFSNFNRQAALSLILLGLISVQSSAQEAIAEAVPTATPTPAKGKSTGTPVDRAASNARPLNVNIALGTGSTLSGTLVEVDVLTIKTVFGEAAPPLAEIAGIRFPQGEDVSTTVVTLNGDSITGATDVKMVTLDTEWGQAKINGSAIRSILFIPNLEWTSSTGISGKRWTLQEIKPTTTAPTTNSPSGAQASRPSPLSNPSTFAPGTYQGSPSTGPTGTRIINGFPIQP